MAGIVEKRKTSETYVTDQLIPKTKATLNHYNHPLRSYDTNPNLTSNAKQVQDVHTRRQKATSFEKTTDHASS